MQIFKSLRISNKVNLIFLAFSLLLLLCFTIPAYEVGRTILEKNALGELHAVALQKELTLRGWLSTTTTFLDGIAASDDLRTTFKVYNDSPIHSIERQIVLSQLTHDLGNLAKMNSGVGGLSVIDIKDGRVLASTIPEEVGQNASDEVYFIEGGKRLFLQTPQYSETLSRPAMRISVPVESTEGRTLGVVSALVMLDRMDEIVDRGRSEQSSLEAYIVNGARQVVVPPNMQRDAVVLKTVFDTEVVHRCVEKNNGGLSTLDYRGVPVVSSFTWMADTGLCLIVERNQKDAFADIRRFSGAVILTGCAAIFLSLILSYLLSRTITRPIYRLLDGVEQFGSGRLDHLVPIDSKDEIGTLSNAFNQMAGSLARLVQEAQSNAEENLRLYREAKTQSEVIEREKAFVSSLFEMSSDPILVLDRAGRVVRYNQAFSQLCGFEDYLIGRAYTDLLSAPLGNFEPIPDEQEMMSGPYPKYFENCFRAHNGTVTYFAFACNVSHDSAGEMEYMILVAVDVTRARQMEEKLRESERHFRMALATAPISIYITDRDLRITFIHDRNSGVTVDRFLGKRMDEIVSDNSASEIIAVSKAVIESGMAQRGQISMLVNDERIYYVYYADAMRDASGEVVGMACAAYDITEQKRVEQALVRIKNNLELMVQERTRELRQSQKILETMLDALPEVAALIDRDGRIISGNRALARNFDMPLSELTGRVIYSFFTPELAAARKERVDTAFANGQRLRYMDSRNGRYYDNIFHPVRDENQQVTSLVIIANDVTDWKRTQSEIAAGRERLKELARQVVMAQEEERRRISRELHDEAGQALTALSISLKLYCEALPAVRLEERQKMTDAVELADHTLEQIRVLAQGLRPQILDALGLNSAFEGHCRDFARRTGMVIEYHGREVPALADIASISLYRFLQEALTNAAKHSQASKIIVSLAVLDDLITVRVRDNGVGFNVEANQKEDRHDMQGIGLMGMRERIEMVGGVMKISSFPGKGTVLVAAINWKGEQIERRRRYDPSRDR